MRLTHIITLLKLRSKLTYNQIKKGGKANTIIAAIFYGIASISVCLSFFVTLTVGAFWFRDVSPTSLLVIWNILAFAFLSFWVIGLIGELQQTVLISIDKLLHLPVSLNGAFFLNYASTFYNITFLFMAPCMLGLAVGLILATGLQMWLAIPLVISFLFLISALTFQLRNWLGGLMENKRNKGTLTAIMIIAFIALSQIPNLASRAVREMEDKQDEIAEENREEKREFEIALLEIKYETGSLPRELNGWHLQELDFDLEQESIERKQRNRKRKIATLTAAIKTTDTYFPPGWLPLGIAQTLEGKWLGGLISVLGMSLIGSVSLFISYRSSMRKYIGSVKKKRKRPSASPLNAPVLKLMHQRLPFCSEQVSAVAMSTIQGAIRAPETKLMLVLPTLGAFALAFLIFRGESITIPEHFWILFPIAAIAMTMFTVVSSVFNQFGMDRDGFRAFVLSPLDRSDILLGKNIALIPLGIGIALVLTMLIQLAFPVGVAASLASLLQIPNNFLLYCLVGNAVSIYFPMGIKRGTCNRQIRDFCRC